MTLERPYSDYSDCGLFSFYTTKEVKMDIRILRTRKQLAAFYKCAVSSTYRFEKEGIIPPPRILGKSKIWIMDELEADLHRQLNIG